MTDDQFTRVYLPRYGRVIYALARKLARHDDELFEDLRAVGMMALWELDPSKAASNEDAWIRQALWNKMVDEKRRQYPMVADRPRFESLDGYLERGAQVGNDAGTGEARLMGRAKPKTPDQDHDAAPGVNQLYRHQRRTSALPRPAGRPDDDE